MRKVFIVVLKFRVKLSILKTSFNNCHCARNIIITSRLKKIRSQRKLEMRQNEVSKLSGPNKVLIGFQSIDSENKKAVLIAFIQGQASILFEIVSGITENVCDFVNLFLEYLRKNNKTLVTSGNI